MSQGIYLRNNRSYYNITKEIFENEKSTCIDHIWCVLICLGTTILGLVPGNQLICDTYYSTGLMFFLTFEYIVQNI